jgi:hypothetical protein
MLVPSRGPRTSAQSTGAGLSGACSWPAGHVAGGNPREGEDVVPSHTHRGRTQSVPIRTVIASPPVSDALWSGPRDS